jgi:hypothetical protein
MAQLRGGPGGQAHVPSIRIIFPILSIWLWLPLLKNHENCHKGYIQAPHTMFFNTVTEEI